MVPETPMPSTDKASRSKPFVAEPEALAIILSTVLANEPGEDVWMDEHVPQTRGRGLSKPSSCFFPQSRRIKGLDTLAVDPQAKAFFAEILWQIWEARNTVIFQTHWPNLQLIFEEATSMNLLFNNQLLQNQR